VRWRNALQQSALKRITQRSLCSMEGREIPGLIGVAVGTLADPSFQGPDRTVSEHSKHKWVDIGMGARALGRRARRHGNEVITVMVTAN